MPHCSLFPWELSTLEERVEAAGRDPTLDIIHYKSDVSHTDSNAFLRVWNYGTPEFSDLTPIFQRLSFSDIYEHVRGWRVSERGNKQDALGVSTQNLMQRCEITSVSLPGMNDGTNLFRDEFAKMSTLGVLLEVAKLRRYMTPRELYRFVMFAARIHQCNLFEGKNPLFAYFGFLLEANNTTGCYLYPLSPLLLI